MKCAKVIAVLLVIILARTGFAQEFYSIKEIQDSYIKDWKAEYVDNFGRRVNVDTRVYVHGENAVPIIKVYSIDHELNAGLFSDDVTWNDGKQIVIYKNNPADFVYIKKSGEQPLIVHRSYGQDVDMDKKYAKEYGTSISIQDMVNHLRGILVQHDIQIENYLFERPKDFSVRCKVKKKTGEIVEPSIYLASFWQELYGLPIICHVNQTFRRDSWPAYVPQLVLGMRNKDEYLIIADAVKEVECIAEDIPLCAFDDIKRSIEDLIRKGNIREVFDVQFGYVVYNDPNLAEEIESYYDAAYYLVPSWVVSCIYIDNPKEDFKYRKKYDDELYLDKRNVIEFTELVINAQTAEAFYPNDRSKEGSGNANYRGYISWEDITR